jgi:hypothetical protein
MIVQSSSYQTCSLCPYYCPSCSVNASNIMVCVTCPLNSFRTLVSGFCQCNSGYFDDNDTVVCQKCSDIFPNCLTCTNRTKCITCATGMLPDAAHSLCTTCMITCATCIGYFDNCTSCNPSDNRILSNNQCICQATAFEINGVCLLCGNVVAHCSSCQNNYSCTGCSSGYTLSSDLKKCIDCQGSINGCLTCVSTTNCTTCKSPFTLIKEKCRCPLDSYTDD